MEEIRAIEDDENTRAITYIKRQKYRYSEIALKNCKGCSGYGNKLFCLENMQNKEIPSKTKKYCYSIA